MPLERERLHLCLPQGGAEAARGRLVSVRLTAPLRHQPAFGVIESGGGFGLRLSARDGQSMVRFANHGSRSANAQEGNNNNLDRRPGCPCWQSACGRPIEPTERRSTVTPMGLVPRRRLFAVSLLTARKDLRVGTVPNERGNIVDFLAGLRFLRETVLKPISRSSRTL